MTIGVEQDKTPQGIARFRDPDQISVTVTALVRLAESWSLSNAEAAALFDISIPTWNRMKAGSFEGSLDKDTMMRASLLIGIFKGLRVLFNGPLQSGWPKHSNTGYIFAGQSPVEKMVAGGVPAMLVVRRHIDALRGEV